MNVTRALWVGMLGAAMISPVWAATGRIHFVGSIVVPAACTADVQIRRGAPNATMNCGVRVGAPTLPTSHTPHADVAVRSLHVHQASADSPRRYVINVTYC